MYIYGFIEKERVTARREEERECVEIKLVGLSQIPFFFFFFVCSIFL